LTSPALTFTTEHLHLIRDDFRCVPIPAVTVLPLSGLKAPLDINSLALGQIFTGNFSKPSPEGNIMPLCLVFPFTAPVFETLTGSERKTCHRGSRCGVPNLGVFSEIPD